MTDCPLLAEASVQNVIAIKNVESRIKVFLMYVKFNEVAAFKAN